MYNQPRRDTRHWIGIAFLAIFAVFVAAMILYMFTVAPTTAPPAGTYYWWFPFGWLWIFIIFFVFFGLFRFAFRPWGGGYYRHYGDYGRQNEAYHILRERYARGEITKDQYDAMMRDLYQPPR